MADLTPSRCFIRSEHGLCTAAVHVRVAGLGDLGFKLDGALADWRIGATASGRCADLGIRSCLDLAGKK
jgi:hypothetical protein